MLQQSRHLVNQLPSPRHNRANSLSHHQLLYRAVIRRSSPLISQPTTRQANQHRYLHLRQLAHQPKSQLLHQHRNHLLGLSVCPVHSLRANLPKYHFLAPPPSRRVIQLLNPRNVLPVSLPLNLASSLQVVLLQPQLANLPANLLRSLFPTLLQNHRSVLRHIRRPNLPRNHHLNQLVPLLPNPP